MAEEKTKHYCLEAGKIRLARAPFRRAVAACPDRVEEEVRLGFSVFTCENPDNEQTEGDAFAFCDAAHVKTEADLKRYLHTIEAETSDDRIVKQKSFNSEEFSL